MGTLAGPPIGRSLLHKVKKYVHAWSQEECGEDMKEIDAMLRTEMHADSRTWMQCDEEESFLKFEISDKIFEDLLEDTVQALSTVHH